jgi:poly-gamma-glutamate capsule biosynthesis protein CapA/YwtB (metallophosphatase superfamily)
MFGRVKLSIALDAPLAVVLLSALTGCIADSKEALDDEETAVVLSPIDELLASPGTPDDAERAAPPEDDGILLSAVGDCTLGDPAGAERAPGSFHKVHDTSGGDMARPFSGVIEVLDQDDLTIANLEGTLTTAKHREDTTFAFRGRPEFASMLVKGSVEIVNLANNHSADCGARGIQETKENLEHAGVGYFGLGTVDKRSIKGIEVVNLGYTGGRLEVRDAMAKAVKSEKRADNLVVVSFHWGIEGEHAANDVQQKLAYAAIDAGADLVLGHHPHVLQGIEVYKGKQVVYSLGNFVFGGNAQPASVESMIFQARFKKTDGVVTPVGSEIIPVHFSGDKTQNDFRPVLVDDEVAARIRKNVDTYSGLLPKR